MNIDSSFHGVFDSKPYGQMTYDEAKKGKPFGISTMVADDTALWLDR